MTAGSTASQQTTSSATGVSAPTQRKLSSAGRQRIQAYVETTSAEVTGGAAVPTRKSLEMLKKASADFSELLASCSVSSWCSFAYFLLKEKPRIEERWTDYVPLRASPLNHEVADVIFKSTRRLLRTFVVSSLSAWFMAFSLAGLTMLGLKFAAVIGANGGRVHDDSVYRNDHLLGAGCSNRGVPMAGLVLTRSL